MHLGLEGGVLSIILGVWLGVMKRNFDIEYAMYALLSD